VNWRDAENLSGSCEGLVGWEDRGLVGQGVSDCFSMKGECWDNDSLFLTYVHVMQSYAGLSRLIMTSHVSCVEVSC
jgi:hypothetical protein